MFTVLETLSFELPVTPEPCIDPAKGKMGEPIPRLIGNGIGRNIAPKKGHLMQRGMGILAIFAVLVAGARFTSRKLRRRLEGAGFPVCTPELPPKRALLSIRNKGL
jgi:hypothetical protein